MWRGMLPRVFLDGFEGGLGWVRGLREDGFMKEDVDGRRMSIGLKTS